ncbi:MAG TPA: hypothetical protein VGK18_01930 [Propionicimonas sp.]|uniref:hypothetical protein n=1 Tax=Propionicimonas sp. TaxID=1955623 RepID=UPI002F41E620
MTGLFIFIAVILLIFGGLEATHRRSTRPWRQGIDTRRDRDLARLEDELRAVAQRDTDPVAPTVAVHLEAPRSASTDHRLVNRIAA